MGSQTLINEVSGTSSLTHFVEALHINPRFTPPKLKQLTLKKMDASNTNPFLSGIACFFRLAKTVALLGRGLYQKKMTLKARQVQQKSLAQRCAAMLDQWDFCVGFFGGMGGFLTKKK